MGEPDPTVSARLLGPGVWLQGQGPSGFWDRAVPDTVVWGSGMSQSLCWPASKKRQGPAGATVGSDLLEAVGAGFSQDWRLPTGGKSWVLAH